MNKKTLYLFFIILICLVFLSGCKNDSSNTSEENVSANKVNTEASINNINANGIDNTVENEVGIGAHEVDEKSETELASFSTKLGGRDTPRSHNISITSSIIN